MAVSQSLSLALAPSKSPTSCLGRTRSRNLSCWRRRSLRPVQDRISHTEAFLIRSRKRLETEIERGHHRIGVNPGWRTPFGRIKNWSLRQILRRRSIAEMEANGTKDGSSKRPKMLANSSPRVGAFGLNNTRWGVDGESYPSSKRVHERMRIFKVLRDVQYGLRRV